MVVPPIGVDGSLRFGGCVRFRHPTTGGLSMVRSTESCGWVIQGRLCRPLMSANSPILFHLHQCGTDEIQPDTSLAMTLRVEPPTDTVPKVLIQPTPFVEEPTTEVATSEPKASPVAQEIVEAPIEVLRLAADLEVLSEELLAVCLEHRQWRQAERSKDAPRSAMNAQRVDRYFALARKLSDEIKQRPIQFLLLSARCSCLLGNWLCDLIRALCNQQRGPEALALYESFRTTLGDAAAEEIAPRLGYCSNRARWRRRHAMRSSAFRMNRQRWRNAALCAQILRESGNRVAASKPPGGSIIVRCFLSSPLIPNSRAA